MKPSMQEGKRRALIVGVTGQDGILLARLLIQRGYQVLGTSRHQKNAIRRVEGFLVESPVAVVQMQPSDFRSVFSVVKNFKPSEIYNLAGQTSVSVSFDEPVETMESISHSNLIFLEVIRLVDASIRYYNAVSTDVFGNIPLGKSASEESPLNPRSPYGAVSYTHLTLPTNREV